MRLFEIFKVSKISREMAGTLRCLEKIFDFCYLVWGVRYILTAAADMYLQTKFLKVGLGRCPSWVQHIKLTGNSWRHTAARRRRRRGNGAAAQYLPMIDIQVFVNNRWEQKRLMNWRAPLCTPRHLALVSTCWESRHSLGLTVQCRSSMVGSTQYLEQLLYVPLLKGTFINDVLR